MNEQKTTPEPPRPSLKAETAACLDAVELAVEIARDAQEKAGRSPAGRAWAVTVTDLQKVVAWLKVMT